MQKKRKKKKTLQNRIDYNAFIEKADSFYYCAVVKFSKIIIVYVTLYSLHSDLKRNMFTNKPCTSYGIVLYNLV